MPFKFGCLTVLMLLPSLVLADIEVTNARVKAPVPGQSISAAYMHISNVSTEDVSLVRVRSESASRIEIHTHTMNDGMMSMVQLETVAVSAGKSLMFKEGAHHLMVFDPDTDAIKEGAFSLVFEFDDGTVVETTAKIEHLMPTHSHQH